MLSHCSFTVETNPNKRSSINMQTRVFMATIYVSLKLLVDTKDRQLLFAEAGKDFVDFLFNMLSLPVATVIRLLSKQGMVGCLENLYDSIENMSETYIQPAEIHFQ
ncbi:hypothetical protein REPUB_Repub13aG0070300 [Reevesia pubescens]